MWTTLVPQILSQAISFLVVCSSRSSSENSLMTSTTQKVLTRQPRSLLVRTQFIRLTSETKFFLKAIIHSSQYPQHQHQIQEIALAAPGLVSFRCLVESCLHSSATPSTSTRLPRTRKLFVAVTLSTALLKIKSTILRQPTFPGMRKGYSMFEDNRIKICLNIFFKN